MNHKPIDNVQLAFDYLQDIVFHLSQLKIPNATETQYEQFQAQLREVADAIDEGMLLFAICNNK